MHWEQVLSSSIKMTTIILFINFLPVYYSEYLILVTYLIFNNPVRQTLLLPFYRWRNWDQCPQAVSSRSTWLHFTKSSNYLPLLWFATIVGIINPPQYSFPLNQPQDSCQHGVCGWQYQLIRVSNAGCNVFWPFAPWPMPLVAIPMFWGKTSSKAWG